MAKDGKQELTDYLNDLNRLFREVNNSQISDEAASVKLAELKQTYVKLSGMFPLMMEVPISNDSNSTKKRGVRVKPKKGEHPMDFDCICKRCVSLHTVGETDMNLLKAMHIEW